MEALTDWKYEERKKQDQQEQVARIMEEQAKERYSGFAQKMNEQREKDPDFMDAVSDDVLNLRPLSAMADNEPKGPLNALAEYILRSDIAPSLVKYFSERKDELGRFGQMDPSTAATPVEMSKAKPPIRPVTGGSPIVEKDLPDDAPFEEFFKRENAKERKSGSRW
jgi:hypothetical protein